eukprot:348501-Pleurochrysis_carterae.AAC.1
MHLQVTKLSWMRGSFPKRKSSLRKLWRSSTEGSTRRRHDIPDVPSPCMYNKSDAAHMCRERLRDVRECHLEDSVHHLVRFFAGIFALRIGGRQVEQVRAGPVGVNHRVSWEKCLVTDRGRMARKPAKSKDLGCGLPL